MILGRLDGDSPFFLFYFREAQDKRIGWMRGAQMILTL